MKLSSRAKCTWFFGLNAPDSRSYFDRSIASGIGLIDKISDQVESFLSKQREPAVPKEHRLKIEQSGSEIVVHSHGQVVQKITGEDLQKLHESMLRHVMVLEKSMQNHYDL